MDYLSTEEMAVGYNKRILISDISFGVRRGEIVALIGPNGAGKSTILKSITGQLELLGGKASVESVSMKDINRKELAKKMAILMTERIHAEMLTCRDVVAGGRYPYTGRMGFLGKEDNAKVEEALELVHASEFAERDFSEISDGQMQRILLARCICQEPEIIVLDEPTSYLDIKHKLELLQILKKLVLEKNMAVILSLHEIDLAQKLADRIICVKGDRINRIGTPEEVFSDAYISELYDIRVGSFRTLTGGMELEKVSGAARAFVIGGGGKGIPLYRKLQREGTPFACGILWENDIEYEIAKALATCVIAEKKNMPLSEESYRKALETMLKCEKVICALDENEFGILGEFNRRLYEEAQKAHLL